MLETLPVVVIDTPNGPVEINERDFDHKVHTLYGAGVKPPAGSIDDMTATELRRYAADKNIEIKGLKSREDLLAAVKAATKPADGIFAFPTADGKWSIVDGEGNPVTDDLYDTQEEAEKAIG